MQQSYDSVGDGLFESVVWEVVENTRTVVKFGVNSVVDYVYDEVYGVTCCCYHMRMCLFTEEELKRLNEALADDDSYSAVSFDYDSSNKTAEESSTAETSHR